MILFDRAPRSGLFIKSEDRQKLLFPGVIDVTIQSFPLLLAWRPQASAMFGDQPQRIVSQKFFQVFLGAAANDGDIQIPLLAEPVQQSLDVGIRCRRPGIKFDFAQRPVIVQKESNPFSGRESRLDLLARHSNIGLDGANIVDRT